MTNGGAPEPAQSPQVLPGWYDDGHGQQRWHDGTNWTEQTVTPARPGRYKPLISTWIVGAIVALFLIIGTASGGFGGFLVFLAIAAFLTGIYGVVTGRRSWALMPGRRTAAVVLATSLVAFIGGGVILPPAPKTEPVAAEVPVASLQPTAKPSPKPSPQPSAEFTDEAPADPEKVETPSDDPQVAVKDTTVTDTTALALLATLPVKGKAPKTGYDRSVKFGSAWLDVDRNGCDTRNDILARDLTAAVKSGPCKVTSGNLVSPFTNTTIAFVRGNDTSALVQIDHVVSLSNAWQTGAQQITQSQRISFANDPINLLAVDGKSNAQKDDGDTATWLPSNKAIRCPYVARQVSVKATYGLWVTQAEHNAMARVLTACSSEPAVTSTFTPAPIAVVKPAPQPKPTPVVVVPPAPVPVPVPVPVAPPPPPAPATPNTVHPGAFCSGEGSTGVTVKGTPMVCSYKPGDDRLRWRSA